MATRTSKARWTTERIPNQQGRRVLITGANSGIGFETALELARHGAEVILPARSLAKANEAIARIQSMVPGAALHAGTLDLASLASVRAFAAEMAQRFPGQTLDLLINNAGVMAVPTRELTPDGFERQFATNYLGPFLLTALTYPLLRQQAGTRIVVVSSSASTMGRIRLDNLQGERSYSPMAGAYAQSKLADSVFAVELQRRLSAAGSPVMAVAAHPGYAITNLQTAGPGAKGQFILRLMMDALRPFASQDAAHGALPTLYAAVAPEAAPGGYYGPDGLAQLTGYPVAVPIAKAALDPQTGTRLWQVTEELVGARFVIPG